MEIYFHQNLTLYSLSVVHSVNKTGSSKESETNLQQKNKLHS